MLTRSVKLQTGLKVGEVRAMSATIREETLDDELTALEAGLSGALLDRTIATRRVLKIGDLENPAPEILRKLTRTDWELIELGQQKMDVEQGVASGLLKPAAKADDGGRDQPGGSSSGDA